MTRRRKNPALPAVNARQDSTSGGTTLPGIFAFSVGGGLTGAIIGGLLSIPVGAVTVGSEFFESTVVPGWLIPLILVPTGLCAVLTFVALLQDSRVFKSRPLVTHEGLSVLVTFDRLLSRANAALDELGTDELLDDEVTSTTTALQTTRSALVETLTELHAQAAASTSAAEALDHAETYDQARSLVAESKTLVDALEERVAERLRRRETARVEALGALRGFDAFAAARSEVSSARQVLAAAADLEGAAFKELEDHLRVARPSTPSRTDLA